MNTENQSTETPPLTGLIVPDTIREKTQAKYTFSIEEIGELGRSLQGARRDYQRIEEELDSIKAEYKAKLTTAELEQDKFGRKLDDGFEMREAFAIVTFNDPARGRKTYRHEDSGEFIKEEAMTHTDWQLPMFRTPDGNDALGPVAPIETEQERNARIEAFNATNNATDFANTEGDGTREDLGRVLDVPNAGQTPMAAALDGAAVTTEQPQMVIAGFDETDWTSGALLKAFRLAAKKAGWPEAAISALRAGLFPLETVDAMKTMLRPHVVAGTPSFETMMTLAAADYPDGGKMRLHFSAIIKAFPEQYPGGDSEHNFTKFQADISDAIEKEIQAARSQEGN